MSLFAAATHRLLAVLAVLSLFLVVWGCVRAPEGEQPAGYEMLSQRQARRVAAELRPQAQGLASWTDLAPALDRSIAYAMRRPCDEPAVNQPDLRLTWDELLRSLVELRGLLPRLDAEPELLAERFAFLTVRPHTLLTGYYEPWLKASLTPAEGYPYPLYGVPSDLKTVDLGRFHPRWKGQQLVYRMTPDGIQPYPDRRDIDMQGALFDKAEILAWAADPVDVFFLQIQGSGRLELPDGTTRHILYAGKNGRQYVSLGRALVDRGLMSRDEVSMQRIRAFLDSRPEAMPELLALNPSYVFFHLADDGPYGSMNAALTPMVSAAVDRHFSALGAALVVETRLPVRTDPVATGPNGPNGVDGRDAQSDGDGSPDGAAAPAPADDGTALRPPEERPFTGLVLAQDTGGAIKATRMDLFCGSSPEAEFLAGHLQSEAAVHLLVSRAVLVGRDK